MVLLAEFFDDGWLAIILYNMVGYVSLMFLFELCRFICKTHIIIFLVMNEVEGQ